MEAMRQGFRLPQGAATVWGATSSSDMGWVQRARPARAGTKILIAGAIDADSRVHMLDERVRMADLLGLARGILLYLADAFADQAVVHHC